MAAPSVVDVIGSDLTRYHIAKSTQSEHESFLTAKTAAEASLAEFVRQGWYVLEPATAYIHSWHIDAMCEHAEAISRGQINKLVVNVPPGAMKSLCWSVFWPVWDWIHNPWRRFLTASYAKQLSTRDAVKSRWLLQSKWFQQRWSEKFFLVGDQNEKTRYENDQRGFRISSSVGGATGERAHIRILDDPHNIEEAESDTIRESVLEWLRSTWS